MEEKSLRMTDYFGVNLAELLAEKIVTVDNGFDKEAFTGNVRANYQNLTLTQRVELIADSLKDAYGEDYTRSIEVLTGIMGEENPNVTGMFKYYYWLMPAGKYIEKYGLHDFDISMRAIGELTKRSTGEYAVRPFLRHYPAESITRMKEWAGSENFHLRRLASEGLRPKLPWAPKLDIHIDDPVPVFEILEMLMYDQVKFVMKSVANNIADYIKVNSEAAFGLIKEWEKADNDNTRWIIRHATRKLR